MTAPVDWKVSSVFQLSPGHNLHFWKGGCDFDVVPRFRLESADR